jgi:multidrug efflux pump subunit AcrB
MHALTNWFIRNPVAANLLMGLILVAGLLSVTQMRIEGFPKVPADSVGISVYYPGASAAQIDEAIAQKLQKALEGLPGTQRIVSFSSDDNAYVRVKKDGGYPLERLLDDIKMRVDAVSTLPQLADRPIISREEFNFPALIVQVYGAVEPDVLQRLGRRVKAALQARPEISKINQWGEEVAEISIELDLQQLEAHDLSYAEIASKINQSSMLYRSGSLTTKAGNIRVRADHQAYRWEDFAQLPIAQRADGSQLLLSDVAHIHDGFVEAQAQVRYQGLPAIGLEIQIDGKGNLLKVSEAAEAVVAQLRRELPEGVKVDIWADQSDYITDRLALLKSNAAQGLLLVLIILSLFLNVRLAFWVAMGIPVSIAGTLWLMGWDRLDYSLNDITTFGMIVVLGVLVDDAIVVGESVFSERSRTADPILGTQRGVHKVATATVFGVLTSVAAFYPMLLIESPLGKVLASFSGVVIIALLFSLIDSKFILPAHLARIDLSVKPGRWWLTRAWARLQGQLNDGLFWVIQHGYRPALQQVLRHRYAALLLFIAMATLGIGLAVTGKVRTSFFPEVPGSLISVKLEMDLQSPFALTQAHAVRLEHMAEKVNREAMDTDGLKRPPIEKLMTAINNAQQLEIYAELTPEHQRSLGAEELVRRWRSEVGALEGATLLEFSGSEETGGGFALTLQASDEVVLKAGVDQLSAALRGVAGVVDVRDDLKGAQPEIYLRLKPEAGLLGISQEQLASEVAHRYGGLEVQRLQRGGDELKVQLRNPREARDSLDDLLQARIMTPEGQWLPLAAVAELQSHYVSGAISRRNGERTATVRASLDKRQLSASELMALLRNGVLKDLQRDSPSLVVSAAGELEEEGAIQGGLKNALLLALLLIYALLAVPLKSYSQPFIIMAVIPFGIAGAIAGHLIADIPLSVLSFFGMLALTGIVVNDSLVLLTTYNQLLKEGMPRDQALVEAGVSRFRAIFLTTVTTLAGLTPLLLETSEQAQYLIPAAVSLVYGELFATLITLFAVPLLTLIFADLKEQLGRVLGRKLALESSQTQIHDL